jgi:hypothetical protein
MAAEGGDGDNEPVDNTSADYKAGYDDGYRNGHSAGYDKCKADMGGDEGGDEDKGDETDSKSEKSGATSAQFVAAFGDVGARWFLEGKSFPEATVEYVGKLKADQKTAVDALVTENADLKTKLAAVDRGNEPASHSIADGKSAKGDGKGKSNHSKAVTSYAEKFGPQVAKIKSGDEE